MTSAASVILDEEQKGKKFENRLSQKQKKTFPTSTLVYVLHFQSSSTLRILQLLFRYLSFFFPIHPPRLEPGRTSLELLSNQASVRRRENFHNKFTTYAFINNKYSTHSAYCSQCDSMAVRCLATLDCSVNLSGRD